MHMLTASPTTQDHKDADEALALARLARQEAALQAKLLKMTKEELENMQLNAKISTDLDVARSALTTTQHDLMTTEHDLAEVSEALARERQVGYESIKKLDSVVGAFSTVLKKVSAFDDQCSMLRAEVAALDDMESQRRMDTHGISGRVKEELVAAEARLASQNATLADLQGEVHKAVVEIAAAEKQALSELTTQSSEAAAKKLNLDLAQQRLALLCTEQAKKMEHVDDTRAVMDKRSRVAATSAQVDDIRAKLARDEATIQKAKAHELAVLAESQMVEAQEEAKLRAFGADKDSLRSLAALQDAFLLAELPALEGQADAAGDASMRKLLEETRKLVSERQASTTARKREVETMERLFLEQSAQADEARQATVRQRRAERKAIEVAHAERHRYLCEKVSQLEIEERGLWLANTEHQEQRDCIRMLQHEIELAHAALADRQVDWDAAEELRKQKANELDAMKLSSKIRVSRSRMHIDAELRIQSEQQSYVDSMKQRLKVELLTIAVDAEGGHEECAPPWGKNGLALTHQNEVAIKAWVAELQEQHAAAESALAVARGALESQEKKASTETQRLTEKCLTQLHEVSKLSQYESSLAARLQSAAPSPPIRSVTPTSTPTKVTKTSTETSFSTPQPVIRTPSLEETSMTPYAASHKYLVTSMATPSSAIDSLTARPLSNQLEDEENHPMYNPDLKFDSECMQSEKRSSIRSRIGRLLPDSASKLVFDEV